MAVVLSAFACDDDTTTAVFTPVTGIVVRAESLVAGFGCGTAPGQVYRYAAVVLNSDNQIVAGATYDCFTDGHFENLVAADSGSVTYTVLVYAFNKDAYTASSTQIEAAAQNPPNPPQLQAATPTWSTSCRATQQVNVEVLAVCDPLAPDTVSSVRVETAQFPNDGGLVLCNTLSGGSYTSVTGTVSINNAAPLGIEAVKCPTAIVLSPAIAPATYTLTLQLLGADGGAEGGKPVGKTTCQANSQPGVQVLAACSVVQ